MAVLFFTGAVWALGRNGRIDFNDGLVLVGLFLFWQCFHVFEVLKNNVRQGKSLGWMLPFDLALLAVGAYAIYVSTDWLVALGFTAFTPASSAKHLGWVSGWIMVLPNAVLAFYYGLRGQPETVYTSQVGDAHVSIPLCLGIYALFHTMALPPFFQLGMLILLGATLVHLFFVAVFGRLPRLVGWLLVAAYGLFPVEGIAGLNDSRGAVQSVFLKNCVSPDSSSGSEREFFRSIPANGTCAPSQRGILGDGIHGLARVVANEISARAQNHERLKARADAVPREFKIAHAVFPVEQLRAQGAEVLGKILQKIVVARAGVRQDARLVFRQRDNRPFVEDTPP